MADDVTRESRVYELLVHVLSDEDAKIHARLIEEIFAASRDAEVEALRGQVATVEERHAETRGLARDLRVVLAKRQDQMRALTEENTAWRERADEIAVKVGQLRAQLAALTEENAELEEEVAELRQWALPKYRDEKSALKQQIAEAERERDEARNQALMILREAHDALDEVDVGGSPRSFAWLCKAQNAVDKARLSLTPAKAPSDG